MIGACWSGSGVFLAGALMMLGAATAMFARDPRPAPAVE
jgi:hypothetical protein